MPAISWKKYYDNSYLHSFVDLIHGLPHVYSDQPRQKQEMHIACLAPHLYMGLVQLEGKKNAPFRKTLSCDSKGDYGSSRAAAVGAASRSRREFLLVRRCRRPLRITLRLLCPTGSVVSSSVAVHEARFRYLRFSGGELRPLVSPPGAEFVAHAASSPVSSPVPRAPVKPADSWVSKVKSSFQPLVKIASPSVSSDGIPSIRAPDSITLVSSAIWKDHP
ncbi:hypothetical protein Bca52824_000137 [Brassica carinata]|uniref:Uncharacterized protein n=1 Tax=Brassica carinata TaxID=52824 RepID=A0A8X8BBW3_BRACI|nr:hypothetical protein Bca52824_000137 [Brassica carinata]